MFFLNKIFLLFKPNKFNSSFNSVNNHLPFLASSLAFIFSQVLFYMGEAYKNNNSHCRCRCRCRCRCPIGLKNSVFVFKAKKKTLNTISANYIENYTDLVHKKRKADLNLKQKETSKLNKKVIKKSVKKNISKKDFNVVLESIDISTFKGKRSKLALILLYITGLRVSNLLSLKLKDLEELFKDNYCIIPVTKSEIKKENLVIWINAKHKKLILNAKYYADIITQNKSKSDYVFTRKNVNEKSLSREMFTKELNNLLKKAEEKLNKKKKIKSFTTHSFRANYITQLTKQHPIEEVSRIIGHKDINSTLFYKKIKLTVLPTKLKEKLK